MPNAEKHTFQKINTDLEDRLLQPEMYRYLLNGVVAASDGSNMGDVENAVGNKLLQNVGITAGSTVLKAYTDPESNTIFYFVSDNTIWRFTSESETFDLILSYAFDFGTINGVDVLNGSLIWSDDSNEYRKINIERALNGEYTKDRVYDFTGIASFGVWTVFTLDSSYKDKKFEFPAGSTITVSTDRSPLPQQPSGTYTVQFCSYNIIDKTTKIYVIEPFVNTTTGTIISDVTVVLKEEDLTFLRRAPRYPLEVTKTQDETFAQNLLQRQSFQFTYRYIYWDNEKSRFAPISKIILVERRDDDDFFDNNNVICRIPDNEDIRATVKSIEWVFRVDNTNEYAIFNTTGPTTRSLNFKNDVAGATIADAEVVISFDDVPLKGNGLKAVQNRVFINNFTTGYDYIKSSIEATVDETGGGTILLDEQIYKRRITVRSFAINGTGEITSDTYEQGWWQNSFGNWLRVNVTEGTPNIAFILGGQGDGILDNDIAYEEYGGEGGFDTVKYYRPEPELKATVYTAPRENVTMFKAGDTYQVGVRYSDNLGRNIGVSTSLSGRVQMPEFEDPYQMVLNAGQINWNLPSNSEIPEWATHYEIVRTRNLSRSFFLQGQAMVMVYGKRDESSDGSTLLTLEGINRVGYDIYLNLSNSTKYKIGYVFSKGDRVKFWTFLGPFDAKIKAQDGPWLVIDNPLTPSPLQIIMYNVFYEIYTPYLGTLDESFFEVGIKYPINNPGTSNREHSVSSGQLVGDIYRKKRKIYFLDIDSYSLTADPRVVDMSDIFTTEDFEAMNPNDDYYEQWVSDIGRPTIVIPEARQQEKRHTLKYGGNYAVDALVNNVSNFNPGDEYNMPLENGPATVLAATNNNLLYFHEREVSSIYINEGFMSTQDGGEQLIRTVQTVSDDRKLRLGHGCINPESIAEYEDKVWWWDLYKGAVCRYSNEGVVPLSDNGMSNYFYRLSRKLLPYKESSKAYGIYDPYLDYYILTFDPVDEIGYAGETFAFSERSKAGVGWFSFQPEQYAAINKTLYSFKDGQLWKHSVSNDCNTFYGKKYDRVLRFSAGQQDKLKVKIWANFRIDAASIATSMDANDQIITLTSGTQEGRVYTHQIENREGVFIGAFRQNVNTPSPLNFDTGTTKQNYMMYNGDVLRSQVCDIEIKNDRTDLSPLYFVTLLYRISEASFK